jgi:hypothetical protein
MKWQYSKADIRNSENFIECDITRVLVMLGIMKLAPHKSLMELTPDWSKMQSCGELMTRKILESSAKIKNVQYLIQLHRLLMNTFK